MIPFMIFIQWESPNLISCTELSWLSEASDGRWRMGLKTAGDKNNNLIQFPESNVTSIKLMFRIPLAWRDYSSQSRHSAIQPASQHPNGFLLHSIFSLRQTMLVIMMMRMMPFQPYDKHQTIVAILSSQGRAQSSSENAWDLSRNCWLVAFSVVFLRP